MDDQYFLFLSIFLTILTIVKLIIEYLLTKMELYNLYYQKSILKPDLIYSLPVRFRFFLFSLIILIHPNYFTTHFLNKRGIDSFHLYITKLQTSVEYNYNDIICMLSLLQIFVLLHHFSAILSYNQNKAR